MVGRSDDSRLATGEPQGCVPKLNIRKLGIVSRDYNEKFGEYYDFSHVLPDVLQTLDKEMCDAALFSLYSIIPRRSFAVRDALSKLECINAVFIEEFHALLKGECCDWRPGDQIVYYRSNGEWQECRFGQRFGSLTDFGGNPQRCMQSFVFDEMPNRFLGNCFLLLCGESNGVKYSPKDKKVRDTFGLRKAIPQEVNIVLNPVHDRMTRFEMKRKREFLSEGGRWVVSVWNKGKKDKNGRTRAESAPPCAVFHNGRKEEVNWIKNKPEFQIGILDI